MNNGKATTGHPEEEYLTRQEFALMMRVNVSTVDRWIIEGCISYWQPRGSRIVRIPRSELERHLR